MDVHLQILTAASEEDRKLLELAVVKDRLGITDASQDTKIEDLILEVSDTLEDCLGRPIARQRYRERLTSFGEQQLLLSRAPVETVGAEPFEITDLQSVAVDATTYEFSNREAGLLFREQGWPARMAAGGIFDRHLLAGTESPNLIATYWAGWVTPRMTPPAGGEDFLEMPALLGRAAWHTFKQWWADDARRVSASSIRLGKFSVSSQSRSEERAIPTVARNLLAKLRI